MQCRAGTEQVGRGAAEVQRSEMVHRCRAAELQRAEMQRCMCTCASLISAPLHLCTSTHLFCTCSTLQSLHLCTMQRFRAGVQVQRSRGVEVVQSRACRGAVAEVQRFRGAEVWRWFSNGAEVVQRCRVR